MRFLIDKMETDEGTEETEETEEKEEDVIA